MWIVVARKMSKKHLLRKEKLEIEWDWESSQHFIYKFNQVKVFILIFFK